MKIVLGTAQFGMNYGINNKRGRVIQTEVFEILNKALHLGVDTIDTAYAYGESEKVLGCFIKDYSNKMKIISKLPCCKGNEVISILKSSLNRLNISSIHGYLMHSFENYKSDKNIWSELEKIKKTGKIKKIGFSVYFPSELDAILKDNLKIDIIQVPFNVFDQRFHSYFKELKKRKVEIYARSVFLQGLVFKKHIELDSYFDPIKDKIERLNLLSEESGIPIYALCLNFVVRNEFIDKVVVGVDSIQHFGEIMETASSILKSDSSNMQIRDLRVDDEKIILPFNWNTNKVVV